MNRQRLDQWLWVARMVRTRTLAAEIVSAGQVRLNRARVTKPGHRVAPGDVLTVALPGRVRVLKVEATAPRRGPAKAARPLYTELAMPDGDGGAAQKADATGAGTC